MACLVFMVVIEIVLENAPQAVDSNLRNFDHRDAWQAPGLFVDHCILEAFDNSP